MYKFVVLAALVAVASAGVQIAAPLGYAGLAAAPLGYAGLAGAPLGYAAAPLGYAAAPAPVAVAAPAPVAYAAPAKAYAVPAPRTIPGPTLKSEVVEPVEIWGYNVEY